MLQWYVYMFRRVSVQSVDKDCVLSYKFTELDIHTAGKDDSQNCYCVLLHQCCLSNVCMVVCSCASYFASDSDPFSLLITYHFQFCTVHIMWL